MSILSDSKIVLEWAKKQYKDLYDWKLKELNYNFTTMSNTLDEDDLKSPDMVEAQQLVDIAEKEYKYQIFHSIGVFKNDQELRESKRRSGNK